MAAALVDGAPACRREVSGGAAKALGGTSGCPVAQAALPASPFSAWLPLPFPWRPAFPQAAASTGCTSLPPARSLAFAEPVVSWAANGSKMSVARFQYVHSTLDQVTCPWLKVERGAVFVPVTETCVAFFFFYSRLT